jgi:hypothetical protein
MQGHAWILLCHEIGGPPSIAPAFRHASRNIPGKSSKFSQYELSVLRVRVIRRKPLVFGQKSLILAPQFAVLADGIISKQGGSNTGAFLTYSPALRWTSEKKPV